MSFIKKIQAEKKSIFLNWFFAYLIVVLIVFIMITVVVYKFVLENVKEEIEASNLKLVEYAVESVDARLKEFDVYSHSIMSDGKFSRRNITMSAYDAYECVMEMKKYKAVNNFMHDVGVFYLDSPKKIFCESGIYDLDVFLSGIYKLKGYSESDFLNDVKSIKMPIMKSFENKNSGSVINGDGMLFYLYPIKDNTSKTTGCVIFIISDESFYQLIKGAVVNGECRFAVWSKSGNRIFDTANMPDMKYDLPNVEPKQPENGIAYTKINKKRLSVCQKTSDYNGWRYSLWMERSEFLNRMIVMRNVFLVSELFIFIMVLILLWYFTYRNYRPVKKLVSILPGYKNGNELSYAINTMIRLFDEREQYEKKLSHSVQVERQLLLCRLLLAEDEEPVREKLLEKNVVFSHLYNIVYIFSLYGYAIDENITFAFINVIEEYAEEYGHGYGVKLLENNTIALILNTDCSSLSEAGTLADKATSLFKTEFNIDVLYGISNPADKNVNLNTAYNQAKNVLLNRLSFGNVPTDLLDSLKKMKDSDYLYFIDSEQNIVEAIKNADIEATRQIIDGVLQSLRKMSAKPQQITDIYGGILISIVKLLSDMNFKQMMYKIIELFSLRNDIGITELNETIKEYAEEICEEFRQRKETANSDMVNELIEYIGEHYSENTISLKQFETVFKKNGSYLSRYFKEKTGIPLMKYIDNVRHEKVKQLLCETELKLSEIAEQVGYIEANNMIRKFKKREGLTPNQYRRLMNKTLGGNEDDGQEL